ncbi:hypothetical protein SUGI_1082620 [Cryptomeria japonica]|nr:hypothetical protein SUGI_1082620 [Cryptomeria japonica]
MTISQGTLDQETYLTYRRPQCSASFLTNHYKKRRLLSQFGDVAHMVERSLCMRERPFMKLGTLITLTLTRLFIREDVVTKGLNADWCPTGFKCTNDELPTLVPGLPSCSC